MDKPRCYSVPTRKEMLEYFGSDRPIRNRLFISPLLDQDQIGDTSIDLRLGHIFSVPKPSRLGMIDIIELHTDGGGIFDENYRESRVPYGQYFTLHPRRSVQIGTLEYVGIPNDLEGIVTLRASVSDFPILANTAQVHPGHRGIISLTLTSNAEFSIKLFPGMRIAELQLRHIDTPTDSPRPSRYHFMTRPLHTELYKDKDLEYLGPTVEPIIIGVVSTIAAGRTSAINHLMETYGFAWFSLAQTLKEEAIKTGIPTLRSSLQDFGNSLRETRGDAYLATKLRSSPKWLMNKNGLVVVDSFKNIAEVEEFRKQRRFTLIGIDAPFQQRWDRVLSRRRQGDSLSLDKFKEQDAVDRGISETSSTHAQQTDTLLAKADLRILNDGNVGQFLKMIDQAIQKLINPGQAIKRDE